MHFTIVLTLLWSLVGCVRLESPTLQFCRFQQSHDSHPLTGPDSPRLSLMDLEWLLWGFCAVGNGLAASVYTYYEICQPLCLHGLYGFVQTLNAVWRDASSRRRSRSPSAKVAPFDDAVVTSIRDLRVDDARRGSRGSRRSPVSLPGSVQVRYCDAELTNGAQ